MGVGKAARKHWIKLWEKDGIVLPQAFKDWILSDDYDAKDCDDPFDSDFNIAIPGYGSDRFVPRPGDQPPAWIDESEDIGDLDTLRYFAIGYNGLGDYYMFDLGTQRDDRNPPVVYVIHNAPYTEEENFFELADNFEGFLKAIYRK
jgi:hypothetical protein